MADTYFLPESGTVGGVGPHKASLMKAAGGWGVESARKDLPG